jgi:hypothetical protein
MDHLEIRPSDKPVDVHFHTGWEQTWHRESCMIFKREWHKEAAKHCDCGGYHRKREPIPEPK